MWGRKPRDMVQGTGYFCKLEICKPNLKVSIVVPLDVGTLSNHVNLCVLLIFLFNLLLFCYTKHNLFLKYREKMEN